MRLLQTQLSTEKAKAKPNRRLIQVIDKAIRKGTMTFSEWQDTGKFTEAYTYMNDNADTHLHVDCTDVVQYLGGVYIQVLKDGTFFLDVDNKADNLPAVEHMLWITISEKLF